MGRVSGKIALITGAGNGQGEAEARLLASEGATVIATDINLEAVSRVVDEINAERPGCALALRHDVSSKESWQSAVKLGVQAFGPVTILVNNAGVFLHSHYEELTLDQWQRTMDINAWSQFVGMQTVIPLMKEAGVGSIINIGSLAGVNGTGRFTAYTASKGAIDAFTKGAAVELAASNIRVNAVHPGVILTPMLEEAFSNSGTMGTITELLPLKRLGRPIDVAYLVLYLASDESWFTTGTSNIIDGGAFITGGLLPAMS